MELRQNELTLNCLSGDGQNVHSPKVVKPVMVAIHDSNIWFQNSHGWGFSVDKDMAKMLLRKIAESEDLPMTVNIHDNYIAEKLSEAIGQIVKDQQLDNGRQ